MIYFLAPFPPPVSGFSATASFFRQRLDSSSLDYLVFNKSSFLNLARFRLVRNLVLQPSCCTNVIVFLSAGFGLYLDLLVALVAISCRKKIVFHHHSFSYILNPSWALSLFFRSFSRSPCLGNVFLCQCMSSRFLRLYGLHSAGRSFIVSNLSIFPPSLASACPSSVGSERISVGLISNLTKEKGAISYLELVKSLNRRLAGSASKILFLMAGPCAPSIQSDVSTATSEISNLEYLGPLYGSQKADFLASLDLFVFPTQYLNEAEPLVLYEALFSGSIVHSIARGCIGSEMSESLVVSNSLDDLIDAVEISLLSLLAEPSRSHILSRRSARRDTFCQEYKAKLYQCDHYIEFLRSCQY